MPSSYTGDQADVQPFDTAPAPDKDPVVRLPLGADGFSTGAWDQGFKNLTNHASYLLRHSAWRDVATSITSIWTFTQRAIFRGASGDTNFAIDFDTSPTARKGGWRINLNGTTYGRVYAVTGSATGTQYELALGCEYRPSTFDWIVDQSGNQPTTWRWAPNSSGLLTISQYTGGAGSFSVFDRSATVNLLTAGLSIVGALATSSSFTAGTGVTTTTGHFTASAGDFVGRHVRCNGAQFLTSDFTLGAGWGTGATVQAITANCNDMGGAIIVQGGTGGLPNPGFTAPWRTVWGVVPNVSAVWQNQSTAANFGLCETGASSSTTFDCTATGLTPSSGVNYLIRWNTRG
jgi:hypothetical protein